MMLYCRRLQYRNRDAVILLQEDNGPCPVIAVANALSLSGAITLPTMSSSSCIPMSTVEDVLRQFLNSRQRQLFPNNRNFQFSVDCALGLLGDLRRGLDVNPKFESIDSFEPTQELSVFDATRLRLVHGMIVDGEDRALVEEIGKSSFNVMSCKATDPHAVPHFMAWILQYPTQLTRKGLSKLREGISPNEICVLFRNNHFSVITKVDDVLYTLVTDVGVAQHRPQTPWETLEDISGEASTFCFADFSYESTKGSTLQSNEQYCNKVAEPGSPQYHGSPLAVAAIPVRRDDEDDDSRPPTPPRRNSQLVKRDGGTRDREVIMLNNEVDQRLAPAARRKSLESGAPLRGEFSQAEAQPSSSPIQPPKQKNDSCCVVM